MTRFALIGVAAFCAFGASASEDVAFASVDTNADGFVSESEFIAWKTADGTVSTADAVVQFIEIDSDASGLISLAEMEAALATAKDAADDAPETMK
ncbi:MAG: hypothetical protein AAGL90_09600 [Pseudomonadota bacterium]